MKFAISQELFATQKVKWMVLIFFLVGKIRVHNFLSGFVSEKFRKQLCDPLVVLIIIVVILLLLVSHLYHGFKKSEA